MAANARSISTCHSHQLTCQLRLKRDRDHGLCEEHERHGHRSAARCAPPPPVHQQIPPGREQRRGHRNGRHDGQRPHGLLGRAAVRREAAGSRARATAQTRHESRRRPPSRTERQRSTVAARGPASGLTDAAAKTDAISSPIGVATTNPVFGWASSTPGVASACRPEEPGAREEGQGDQDRAAHPGSGRPRRWSGTASATLTAAVKSTSQKWLGWCSHSTSSSGRRAAARGQGLAGSSRITNGQDGPVGDAAARSSFVIGESLREEDSECRSPTRSLVPAPISRHILTRRDTAIPSLGPESSRALW